MHGPGHQVKPVEIAQPACALNLRGFGDLDASSITHDDDGAIWRKLTNLWQLHAVKIDQKHHDQQTKPKINFNKKNKDKPL